MPNDTEIVLRSDPADAPITRREAAPGQPRRPAESPTVAKKAPRSRGRLFVRGALFALLPLALLAGGYWYVTGGQVMSTDDAYVEADKVGVSTDVSGIVMEVDVTEN
jgi:membrane fusion protein (multidrug efflux system)